MTWAPMFHVAQRSLTCRDVQHFGRKVRASASPMNAYSFPHVDKKPQQRNRFAPRARSVSSAWSTQWTTTKTLEYGVDCPNFNEGNYDEKGNWTMPVEAKFACSGFAGMPCPDESTYTMTVYGSKYPNTYHVFGMMESRGWHNTRAGMWRCPECVKANEFYQYALADALRRTASEMSDSNEGTFDTAVLAVSARLEARLAIWDEISNDRTQQGR